MRMTQIECKLGDLDPQVSPDELRELDAAERLVPLTKTVRR